MKIEKLNSGHYRIRKTVDGVPYSVVVKDKPTNREALLLIEDRIRDLSASCSDSFSKCANAYIQSKLPDIISPSTARKYTFQLQSLPAFFCKLPMNKIDNYSMQRMVNELSRNHCPASIRRTYSFVKSVINMFRPVVFRVRLPLVQKKQEYIPTLADVKALISAADDRIRPYIYLLSYGLRIGELYALQACDIGSGCIKIDKGIVYGLHYEKIVKSPKTVESVRTVYLPVAITDYIKSVGIIPMGDKTLRRAIFRLQDSLGIPRFSFHKFRKFFASYLHMQGVPDKYIMSAGGWSTPNVMKDVYIKAYESEIKAHPVYLPI